MKKITIKSLIVLSCTLLTLDTASAVTLVNADNTISTDGTLSLGGLTFSNFQFPTVSFFTSPQAALNDGGDVKISAINSAGNAGLRFSYDLKNTTSFFVDATGNLVDAVGNNFNKDLFRNVTFNVTVQNPQAQLQAVQQALGPNSGVFQSVINNVPAGGIDVSGTAFTYDAKTGTVLTSQLFSDAGVSSPFSSLIPAGTFAIGALWELNTNHGRGASLFGTGQIDRFDVTFSLTPVPLPAAFWMLGSGLAALMGWSRRKGVNPGVALA
jgi:hypothetical protein